MFFFLFPLKNCIQERQMKRVNQPPNTTTFCTSNLWKLVDQDFHTIKNFKNQSQSKLPTKDNPKQKESKEFRSEKTQAS